MLKAHKYSETDCQTQVVKYIDLLKQQTKRIDCYAFPSECFDLRKLGKARNMGFRKGWLDLVIVCEGLKIGFFEFKIGKVKVTDEQKAIHKTLRDFGFAVYVIRADTPNAMTDKVAKVLREDFGFKEATAGIE